MIFQPLFAIDFWEALVPVVTIILLVLSQVLGGKDKQEAKRLAEQQRRRGQQPVPAAPAAAGDDPVRQEIDEFLRRAGETDARSEEQQREQRRQENQRRAEEERRRRQAANQPELQRRNYDPMAEGSAHYQGQRPQRGPAERKAPRAPRTRPQPAAPEVVEAVVVEEVIESGKLHERQLKPTQRARPEGVGAEFYETLDAENDLRDAGAIHTYETKLANEFGEMDNPLAVGRGDLASEAGDQTAVVPPIDFAAAVAGIFQDPVRAKEAIIAREILERPNFDRW